MYTTGVYSQLHWALLAVQTGHHSYEPWREIVAIHVDRWQMHRYVHRGEFIHTFRGSPVILTLGSLVRGGGMGNPSPAFACWTLAWPETELAAVVGRKPVRWCWCWAKLLARQELAGREPGESYCSLDEGHFPFRMAWQMLSRRLMMTRSYRERHNRRGLN